MANKRVRPARAAARTPYRALPSIATIAGSDDPSAAAVLARRAVAATDYWTCEIDWPGCESAATHSAHPSAADIVGNPRASLERLRRLTAPASHRDELFVALAHHPNVDKAILVRLARYAGSARLAFGVVAQFRDNEVSTARIEKRACALLDRDDLPSDALDELALEPRLSEAAIAAFLTHKRTGDFHVVRLVRRIHAPGACERSSEKLRFVAENGGPVARTAVALVPLRPLEGVAEWDDKRLLRAARTFVRRISSDPAIAEDLLHGLSPGFEGTAADLASIASLLA